MITFEDTSGITQLEALAARLDDLTPVVDKIAAQVLFDVKLRIKDTKLSPDGKAWQPWAPLTYNLRHLSGNVAGGLLYDTGALFNSIVDEVDGSFGFSVTTDLWYAEALQNGKDSQPARPFLGWTVPEQAALDLALRNYLEGALQ